MTEPATIAYTDSAMGQGADTLQHKYYYQLLLLLV